MAYDFFEREIKEDYPLLTPESPQSLDKMERIDRGIFKAKKKKRFEFPDPSFILAGDFSGGKRHPRKERFLRKERRGQSG